MALPYIKPGVSISEVVSPQLTPVLLDPNVIALVGPGQGYEEHVETFVLYDNAPVTLSATGVDPDTIVVRDASDVTLTPFDETVYNSAPGVTVLADYDVDTTNLLTTGTVAINRSMQTTIVDGEEVTIYYETDAVATQANSHTLRRTLTALNTTLLDEGSTATIQPASIFVAKEGNLVKDTDYTIAGSDPVTTIVWINSSNRIKKFQTVYLDYTVASGGDAGVYTDVAVQLNNVTPITLPTLITKNTIVVKTAPGTFTANVTDYDKGTTEDLDYMISGTGATTTVRRSQGSTTIGGSTDQLTVRVSYRATPLDYYQPTRCFSQGDVEIKFGPAFASDGTIQNPLALAALFAFQNGASQIVAQALFSGTLIAPIAPTGALGDWQLALEQLRSVQDIGILVPIISSGDLSTPSSDALSLSIFEAIQTHIRYMAAQENQFILAILGEDGTGNTLATASALQAHADGLGQGFQSESVMLLSPSSFTFANPVTGVNSDIGGQYVAAAVAGMAARYPVQMPLTRKRINGLTSLKTLRTETQKNQDAQAGLAVVENKRGRIQVRHSITTNQDTRAQQEFSVVRSKYWMMKNLVEALDTQAVGQLILDAQANFLVQVLVSAELQMLVDQGAIVDYSDIQVRPDPSDPTALQVRFSYLPAYPLNRVAITFSITQEQGVTFDQSTTTQGF